MALPTSDEYRSALQNLGQSVNDDELRNGLLALTSVGLPMFWSGEAADVYRVHCPQTGNTWALKCFTCEVAARQERYRRIAEHLNHASLPFTVAFRYLERGIRVAGAWYPAVKMQWVDGHLLSEFVEANLEHPKRLRQFLNLWVKMAERLRAANMAHTDLQHGNVLLAAVGDKQLALRLIDYDGIFIPSLAQVHSEESGHTSYQHPLRLQQCIYSAELDRFPQLVIYCAIHCLATGGPQLWERFNNGDNLLFREQDFREPGASELLRMLWQSDNEQSHTLAGRLVLACTSPLETTPALDDVIRGGQVRPLNARQIVTIDAILATSNPSPQVAATSEHAMASAAATYETPWLGNGAAADAATLSPGATGVDRHVGPPKPPLPAGKPAASQGVPEVDAPFSGRVGAGIARLGRSGIAAGNRAWHALGVAWQFLNGPLIGLVGEEHTTVRRFVWLALPLLMAASGWLAAGVVVRILSAPTTARTEATEPESGPKLELAVDLGDGTMLEMVLIPPGEFTMGQRNSDRAVRANGLPQRAASIARPFYLGKYEVTQQQWKAVMGKPPTNSNQPRNPVSCVSWEDCQEFLRRLNERRRDSLGAFRMPTEAEWEYACRAGATTRFSFGDDTALLGDYGWFAGNSDKRTHPVGRKKPNAWGLFDMHGNVAERCGNWSGNDSPRYHLPGRLCRESSLLLGGSYLSDDSDCWCAGRSFTSPAGRDTRYGFRVARSMSPSGSVDVAQPARPLQLQPIRDRLAKPGDTVRVTVQPVDPEKWKDRLWFSLGRNPPPGTAIDARTGRFTWMLDAKHKPGIHRVCVQAEAPDGQQASVCFSVVLDSSLFYSHPASKAKLDVSLGKDVVLEMVLIPAREFMMGSSAQDVDANSRETPLHRVRITWPFHLGKYEVTQEQWETVMGGNPSQIKAPNNPVEQVSWNDCQEFLRRLNTIAGSTNRQFQLPTEAQWEYACRAGSDDRYGFGDNPSILNQYAWYGETSVKETQPVGRKRPNHWGLYDMHGNVCEWCADWFDGRYQANGLAVNPAGPHSGTLRTCRGGSYRDDATAMRSASRDGRDPHQRSPDLGFRVALTSAHASWIPHEPQLVHRERLRFPPIPPRQIEPGGTVRFTLSPENTREWNGQLRFSLDFDAPAGAAIDAQTGQFSWTPAASVEPGRYRISVSVESSDGQQANTMFTIRVMWPSGDQKVAAADQSTVLICNGAKLEMILIPAGSFEMGSPDSDKQAAAQEKPEHQVRITRPFYLGKYEVTQAQWEAIMGGNPSHFKEPSHPVEGVGWNGVQEFIVKLNDQLESGDPNFRLPTEAEWEYACRAHTYTPPSIATDPKFLGLIAWYSDNADDTTHPVGRKKPNRFGLYDMCGNVWEWTADRYDSRYYANSPVDDPPGPVHGSLRVIRGGSWRHGIEFCRLTSRNWRSPDHKESYVGFRLAKSLAPGTFVPLPPSTQPSEPGPPLKLQPIASQQITAGEKLTFQVAVDTPDYWTGKVVYALAPGAPPGAAVSQGTGVFSWKSPADHRPGLYYVTITGKGRDGQKTQCRFSILVKKPNPASNLSKETETVVDLGDKTILEMVRIPAGEFLMGSLDSDADAASQEKPQHRVRITRPFLLGRYEVTQRQWTAVMGQNPSQHKRPGNPVENLSWDDCQRFLKKLNAKLGNKQRQFRLPTEAEWEYACRAGAPTRYSFGDDARLLNQYAWCLDNSDGHGHPVGLKTPNAWGLYDVYGNVSEWCEDVHDVRYYANSPVDDPAGHSDGLNRVNRGGCWASPAGDCRSASRSGDERSSRLIYLGFRVAVSDPGQVVRQTNP